MQRSHFLKLGLLAGVGCCLELYLPGLWAAPGQRQLVLLELSGGNDGLNTVVPFADPSYYQLRPQLALERNQLLQLTPSLGLHPALKALWPLWQRQQLAIVLGVGYPQPNRSHFRSIEIWETASDSQSYLQQGWLGRLLPQLQLSGSSADGVVLGKADAGPLEGSRFVVVNNPQDFVRQAQRLKAAQQLTRNQALQHILNVEQQILAAAQDFQLQGQQAPRGATFPATALGRQLATVAALVQQGVRVPVFKLAHGSFDTHSRQRPQHERLLRELAEALAAFQQALQSTGHWQQVLLMTYSEFGRRAAENASGGTDHGTAAPQLIVGGAVKGGLYGQQPGLQALVNQDLGFTVDYRSLYTTLARKWWGSSARFLAAGDFPSLGFL